MAKHPAPDITPEEQALETLAAVLKDEEEVMAEALAGWKSGTNSGLKRSTLLGVAKAHVDLKAKLDDPFGGGIPLDNGNTLYPPIT